MRMSLVRLCLTIGLIGFCCLPVAADCLQDDFASGAMSAWTPYWEDGAWAMHEGALRAEGGGALAARLAPGEPQADVVVEAEIVPLDGPRRNFGIVVRAREGQSCIVVRYYDRDDRLQIVPYVKGKVGTITSAEAALGTQPAVPLRFKVAAIGGSVLGKCWPSGESEPDWQVSASELSGRPGGAGVVAEDGTHADFRSVRVCWGAEVEPLRKALIEAQAAREAALRAALGLRAEATPFVTRGRDGAKRRIEIQPMAGETPYPVAGALSLTFGETHLNMAVEPEEWQGGPLTLYLPEPESPQELAVSLTLGDGQVLEARATVAPARHWTFYMTPHTHYDIGFTDPQPAVIERLTTEMNDAVRFCDETADWPEESRYRWTVEVSSLMKQYIDRHSPEKVERFMALVRAGRIEICGYYLNMPTELVGHEELIRCLYYGESLRREYNVPIDTVMINDVPGYTWALADLLAEAGVPRAAFRANSIRGQFLWDRPGAVKRPFYWEGPAGGRVFVWYTDSYREGNFFREPGLHEADFLKIIQRNEQAGTTVDLIQLRMGGDNLPPDLDASANARAWNEKYLWPRVVVATNREYLETLEKQYGAETPAYRGDIPSWWAEGPASTALETGMTRLNHDRLTTAEFLHTVASLANPAAEYPRDLLRRAYDAMIHFDEHTWGASESVSAPESKETRTQWAWKARQAQDAQTLTDALLKQALDALGPNLPVPKQPGVAVWNTAAWPRDEAVCLPLAGSPFDGAASLLATDPRVGVPMPVQVDADGNAWFVARNVPAFGFAFYELRAGGAPAEARPVEDTEIENTAYRVRLAAENGAWVSWRDLALDRELLDPALPGNTPVRDVPEGGREAVNRKQPVTFSRTVAEQGTITAHVEGPVFSEITRTTQLPGCPEIVQRLRLYRDTPWLDVENVMTKALDYTPEVVYFAFPFAVPAPQFRVLAADAAMRPITDQLALSCMDFYSVQHWIDVAGDGFGVWLAPLEAPVVSLSDMNTYRWADSLTFDRGHVYSMPINNCWDVNFRAGQDGALRFRYRLGSYAGEHDPVRTTECAASPFHPLLPVWVEPRPASGEPLPASFLDVAGDPVFVSCVKLAETGEGFIVRVVELRGKPARCTLRFSLPGGRNLAKAFTANCLEANLAPLPVTNNGVTVELKAHQIATLRLVPQII